ncbi:MAG: hypothetical protein FWE31_05420 [Firmicutes bacterium]|nr:hypothetical protein [Bacillota bacterium]
MSYIQKASYPTFKRDANDEYNGYVREKEIEVQSGETLCNVQDRLMAFRNAGIAVYAMHNEKKYSSQSFNTIKEMQEICDYHQGEIDAFVDANFEPCKYKDLQQWEKSFIREAIKAGGEQLDAAYKEVGDVYGKRLMDVHLKNRGIKYPQEKESLAENNM